MLINRKLCRISNLEKYNQSFDINLAQINLNKEKENSAYEYSRDSSTKLVSAMFKRQDSNVDPDCAHLLVGYHVKIFNFKS